MLQETIQDLILSEKDVIPFLKDLSDKEKRELVPLLKVLRKKVFESKQIETKTKYGVSLSFEPTHSDVQRLLMNKACFVCFNKTDARKILNTYEYVNDDFFESILSWYVPKWFSDLVNEDTPWSLDYVKIMELSGEGILFPSSKMIIDKLPGAIVKSEGYGADYKSYYKPEILLLNEETLKTHIWLLFEEDSLINSYYNYSHMENYDGGNEVWITTFKNLVDQGKLERLKVLRATIYTATKGFNKTLSGWFFDLLIALEPSEEEVLLLQEELFTVFGSPHSKVINTVLKYFKKIAPVKGFNALEFAETSSVLLSSETKSIVNSTLMIFDKVAKSNDELREIICHKSSEAFLNLDEKIQLRATKLIAKYGDKTDDDLKAQISEYTDSLYTSSKETLAGFLINETTFEEDTYEIEASSVYEVEIESYQTFDEILFFVNQSIDNNEVYHIDQLMTYVPLLNNLITKENVSKLEPLFKRCIDLILNRDWRSRIGLLELEAAKYLHDWSKDLLMIFPAELKTYNDYKHAKFNELLENPYNRDFIKNAIKSLDKQGLPDYIYQTYRFLFLKSSMLLRHKRSFGLLSMPTHFPCWIHPEILIERILEYEKNHESTDIMDFQVSIGRLSTVSIEINELSIDKIKDEEVKNVLKYHFGFLNIENLKITRPELWLQSVISRNMPEEISFFEKILGKSIHGFVGLQNWEITHRDHFYDEYDYQTRKYVKKKMIRKELGFIENSSGNDSKSFLNNALDVFKRKKEVKLYSIYDKMYLEKQRYETTLMPHDDLKFLYLIPNNPSALLIHVIKSILVESTFYSETGKKNMINLLNGLHEIWVRGDFNDTTYLFLSTGLLCSDKVAREMSAEVLLKAINQDAISSIKLGQIVGELQSSEYAPQKRLNDLIVNSIYNTSKRVNRALLSFIHGVLFKLSETPIRGLNKLLEIYYELRVKFPDEILEEEFNDKMESWSGVRSLTSIVAKIRNLDVSITG